MAEYATIDMGEISKEDWWEGRVREAAIKAVGRTQNDVVKMFALTTATWRHKPDFRKSPIRVSGGIVKASVYTKDKNYVRVNFGTRPRIITSKGKPMSFHTGFTPKTQPGKLAPSGGGYGGKKIARRKVGTVKRHSIKARNFDKQIVVQTQPRLRDNLIDSLKEVGA